MDRRSAQIGDRLLDGRGEYLAGARGTGGHSGSLTAPLMQSPCRRAGCPVTVHRRRREVSTLVRRHDRR